MEQCNHCIVTDKIRYGRSHQKNPFVSHISTTAMASEPTGKGILLKADPISATFLDEVKQSLAKCTRPPKLVGILSTSSAPSKSYADFTQKQCTELGIEFALKKTGAALSLDLGEGEGAEDAIIEANEDDSVDGIMVCRYAFHTV